MALRSSLARLARSDLLSKPAGAPVFSADLTEAKARSRQFFRDVSDRPPRRSRPRRPERTKPSPPNPDYFLAKGPPRGALAGSASPRTPALTPRFPPFFPPSRSQVCRQVPWAMREFFLEEVTTTAKFRSQLANEWRRHRTDDSRVIDVMLFKANQELVTVLAHHFQRHHLITKYVAPESNAINRRSKSGKPQSKFLSAFLDGKATE